MNVRSPWQWVQVIGATALCVWIVLVYDRESLWALILAFVNVGRALVGR